MKSPDCGFFILAAIACSLFVPIQCQDCTCGGGLGKGTNPCSCSDVVVKAAKLPKPSYYITPQQVKDSANVKSYSSDTSSSSQCSCSNSQSETSRSSIVIYGNSNANGNANSNSNSQSGSESCGCGGKNNQTPYSNVQTAQSGSESCGCGGKNNQTPYSNVQTAQSDTTYVYPEAGPSGSTEAVVYSDEESYPDQSSESAPECPCAKQNIESLDTDDSGSGIAVPRFSPIGDLCYPLPTDRSGKAKEKEKASKVIPAYPGKVVCCNPSVPYEVCVNTLTGETKTKVISSSSSDTSTSVQTKSGIMYATPNSAIYNIPPLVYAKLNKVVGRKGHMKSADCFDDYLSPSGDGDKQSNDYYPAMPADAVSLTLAYKNLRAPNVIYSQGKQFVPEDKLSFGHRTLPSEEKSSSKAPDIPEEKLVTVNKPVVELKLTAPKTVVIGSYDEQEEAKLAELEAIERESINQEETSAKGGDGLITYKDLGYAPIYSTYVRPKSYNQEIISKQMDDSAEEPCGPLGPPIPGYKAGKVIVQQQIVPNSSEDYDESMETGLSDTKSCPT